MTNCDHPPRRATVAGWLCQSSVLVVAILGGALSGCATEDEPAPFEPTEWQGVVDESLPKGVQERQDALIRLFTAIQQVGIDRIHWDCPDIDFRESFDEFFGETVDLYRWSWVGPPDRNRFQVLLVLRKDDAKLTQVEHHRTYSVARRGGSFVVRRANEN